MSQLGSSTRYCSRCLSTFEDDHERCPNLACRRPRPGAGWGRMYGPGDVFDRHYRIHSLLALGGAGVTYLAREVGPDGEEIGPRLALKVLFASRDEGPYLRRLATEAQILQELDHPNIVQYLGFVHRAGHSPYLVTRFEPGGSLLDHIKRVGSMDVKRACQVCRQICWALDKAHAMGVVHRDLKPENVLLARVVGPDEDPVVRVADFGIAKIQGSLGSMTRVGAFVGTPQYAAPEQFVGAAPTPATDVYAAGALLYFMTMVMPVAQLADRLEPAETYQLLLDSLPPVIERSHDDVEAVRRVNRVLEVCMAADAGQRCTIDELDKLLGAIVADREPDIEAVATRAPVRPAGRDPAADLLAPVGTLPADAGKDPGAHPSRQPTPVPTRSQAEETAPAGSGAPPLAPPRPTATGGATAPTRPMAPPVVQVPTTTVTPTDVTPAPRADPPAVAQQPKKKRRGCGCVSFLLGGAALLVGLPLAGWAWLAWSDPQALPEALRPAEVVLDPTADAQAVAALRAALVERLVDVRAHCEPDEGAFTVELVVQPDGRVSALTFKALAAGMDGQCVGAELVARPLPSPGLRPARATLELDLAEGAAP